MEAIVQDSDMNTQALCEVLNASRASYYAQLGRGRIAMPNWLCWCETSSGGTADVMELGGLPPNCPIAVSAEARGAWRNC